MSLDAPVTHRELRWWIRRATLGYLILALGTSFAIGFAIKDRNDRIKDVARAGAHAVFVGCVRSNEVSGVLRQALAAQLQLLDRRRARGEVPDEDYVFARAALVKRIGALAPRDCAAQAAAISSAVNH